MTHKGEEKREGADDAGATRIERLYNLLCDTTRKEIGYAYGKGI